MCYSGNMQNIWFHTCYPRPQVKRLPKPVFFFIMSYLKCKIKIKLIAKFFQTFHIISNFGKKLKVKNIINYQQ